MQWDIWFIPHHKWLWYICEGWTVEPLRCHHGLRSMMASRKAR